MNLQELLSQVLYLSLCRTHTHFLSLIYLSLSLSLFLSLLGTPIRISPPIEKNNITENYYNSNNNEGKRGESYIKEKEIANISSNSNNNNILNRSPRRTSSASSMISVDSTKTYNNNKRDNNSEGVVVREVM